MSTKRLKQKARRTSGNFGMWPHVCGKHENFARLSINARALLLELIGQCNGFNNGDLTCAYAKVLKFRGWKSRTTVDKACRELERLGWIVRTRQGGKNKCNLYALTFHGIDECNGKLDVGPSAVPLGYWKLGHNPWLVRDTDIRPKGNGVCLHLTGAVNDAQSVGKSVKAKKKISSQARAELMPTRWASPDNPPSEAPL